MSRKVFDVIASSAGVVVVVVLVIAGGLLTWGHSFVNSNVHSQLAQQQVYFPPKAAFDHPKAGTEITPSMIPSVSKYAGQQLLTGQQANTYADSFIAVHLSEMPYGGVYSKASAGAADPTTSNSRPLSPPSSGAPRYEDSCSRPTPSRRSARSCSGAIASFLLAALMSVLVGLGFWHARRTTEEAQVLVPKAVPASA